MKHSTQRASCSVQKPARVVFGTPAWPALCAVLQVWEEVQLRAPCAVAAQLLLQSAALSSWPPAGGDVAHVAQSASQAWTRRGEAETAAAERQREGLLACVCGGWPWFSASGAAVEVLVAAAGSAERQSSGAAAGGSSTPVATAAEQVSRPFLGSPPASRPALLYQWTCFPHVLSFIRDAMYSPTTPFKYVFS